MTGLNLRHTRDQEFAADSYERVAAFKVGHAAGEPREKYRAMANSLPALILSAGLAQALTFADSRDEHARQLLDDLAATLGYVDREALVQASVTAELADYMILARTTLAALQWYKRFAQSLLKGRGGSTGAGGA